MLKSAGKTHLKVMIDFMTSRFLYHRERKYAFILTNDDYIHYRCNSKFPQIEIGT